jgi:LAO/AO transport system kinase
VPIPAVRSSATGCGCSRTAGTAGYDPILVETVGVGQDEVDVVKTADAVLVVLVPGMGDDIQAIKAGILEIADLFVINKADHNGVERLHAELRYMISLAEGEREYQPAILQTIAVRDEGVAELLAGIGSFIEGLDERRRAHRRRERAHARLVSVLTDRVMAHVLESAFPGEALQGVVDEIARRQIDPYSAAERVLARLEIR